MCRRIDCRKCGKPTFSGCGMHVEQVLAGVPRDQRCRCAEKSTGGAADKPGGAKPWWQLW